MGAAILTKDEKKKKKKEEKKLGAGCEEGEKDAR